MKEAALELARKLMWEPPGHDDYPGVIPDGAWPVWRRFETFALQEIAWCAVYAAAWRHEWGAVESPQFDAIVDGQRLALTQQDWHGFPDPPEWGFHLFDDAEADWVCLGNFDNWPASWSANGGGGMQS